MGVAYASREAEAYRLIASAGAAVHAIARRKIVQRLGETVPGELLGQRLLREGIEKAIFDAAEAGLGRGLEAGEKVDLVEQHGEVGGEFRHRLCSFRRRVPVRFIAPIGSECADARSASRSGSERNPVGAVELEDLARLIRSRNREAEPQCTAI